jgi:hypothetical protein
MGRRFHAHINPPWPFSDDGFTRTMQAIKASGYLAQTDGGFIAGVMADNPMSDNWPIAKEFLWWAEDGSGLRLRRGFKEWAIRNGAREIQWSCPPNARARAIFARSAQETETIYSEYPPCASALF